MRLIDADALMERYGEPCHSFADVINGMPTIEAEPVRHAYWMGWEYDGYADGFPVFESWLCSECGEDFRSEGDPPAFDYCPRCGARMDGEAE